ncbi:MAG: DUF4126 domain-containing protein, partial [Salinisphaera sp.]|nr:DUF4126 domain-containing protein [Salinisphaera sp.]
MDIVSTIAATLGVAWASGINLYAAILMLGWMGSTGQMDLPPDLEIVQSPGVMLAAGLMYCVEFFADKVPGVDTGWDTLHTFIRIPVGALLAAGAAAPLGPEAELIGLILGGTLSAGTHLTKAGARVLINTSPEPFTNWTASISEDLLVIAGLWTALHYPLLYILLLAVFVALVIWLLPKIWRGIKRVFAKLRQLFSGNRGSVP